MNEYAPPNSQHNNLGNALNRRTGKRVSQEFSPVCFPHQHRATARDTRNPARTELLTI